MAADGGKQARRNSTAAATAKKKTGKSILCSAINCTNYAAECPALSFFSFPRDEQRSKKWLLQSGLKHLKQKSTVQLNKSNYVCAKHFEDKQFTNGYKDRLNWNAVPSLFPSPNSKASGRRKRKKFLSIQDTELAAQALLAMSSNNSSEVVQTTPDIGVSVVDKFISVGSQSEPVSVRHWQTQTLTPPQKNEKRKKFTQGYTGLFFLFHPKSKRAKVEWIQPSISDRRKAEVEQLLIDLLSGGRCRRLSKPMSKGVRKAGSALAPQHVPDSKDGLISSDTDRSSLVVTEDVTADRQIEQESGQLPNVEKAQFLVKPGITAVVDGAHLPIAQSIDQLSDVGVELVYPCPVCPLKFPSKAELSRHKLGHRKSGVECKTCGKRLSSMVYLKTHMMTHTGEKPHHCTFCNKQFIQRVHLRRHLVTHTKVKDFSCSVCPKRFASRTELSNHMCIHTGERRHLCAVCGKGFIIKRHLMLHEKTHCQRQCDTCGKVLYSNKAAVFHAMTHAEKSHQCHICHQKFGKKGALASHVKKHERLGDIPQSKLELSAQQAKVSSAQQIEEELSAQQIEELSTQQIEEELSAQQIEELSTQQIEELSAQRVEEELAVGYMLEMTDSA